MLDPYSRRARLAPALLAAVPAVGFLVVGAISVKTPTGAGSLVLGAVALVICGLVRDAGRRLQPALWESWGGSPTVRRLRWRTEDDHEAVRQLHSDLSSVLGRALPSVASEMSDPVAADRQYEAAVAVLRERTRDSRRFRLVFMENAEYGFRRNALGLRPVALTISIVALVASVLLGIFGPGDLGNRVARWLPCGAISLVAAAFWWWVVGPDWVRRSADIYADRLFEAIATLKREP